MIILRFFDGIELENPRGAKHKVNQDFGKKICGFGMMSSLLQVAPTNMRASTVVAQVAARQGGWTGRDSPIVPPNDFG